MGMAALHSAGLQICAFNWGCLIQVKITVKALQLLWFIWFNLNYLAQVSKSKRRTHLRFFVCYGNVHQASSFPHIQVIEAVGKPLPFLLIPKYATVYSLKATISP